MVEVKFLSTKGSPSEFEKVIRNFIANKKGCTVSHSISKDPRDKSTIFTALVIYDR